MSAKWTQIGICGRDLSMEAVILERIDILATGPCSRYPLPLPVSYTPAINAGCTRSLRISHTSRQAPLQPVPKAQVPCTPYRSPNITGVMPAPLHVRYATHTQSLMYREGCLYTRGEMRCPRYSPPCPANSDLISALSPACAPPC
jgi:hypothetical protein